MKKNDAKKQGSIGRSLLIGTIVSVLLICDIMGVHGFFTYRYKMMERYQSELENLLYYIAGEIDGDDLEKCIESGENSEKYDNLQKLINRVMDSFDIEYIYIIKPLNSDETENALSVMAGASVQESETQMEKPAVILRGLTGDYFPPEMVSRCLECLKSDVALFFESDSAVGLEYTGMIPIKDSEGNAFAVLGVDMSLSEIRKTLIWYSIAVGVWVWILVVVASFFVTEWLKKRVIKPLDRLKNSAWEFVALSHRTKDPSELVFEDPDIHSNDEMESLSESIKDMVEGMKRYMSDLIVMTGEKERIGAELEVASSIQMNMLPQIYPLFSDREEFSIYASMEPAKEVGGDFYDFFFMDDSHLVLVVADVSGKGVPAALFMAKAKTLIRCWAQMGYEPGEVLFNVNNQLCDGNERNMFVTVWMAVLDLATGRGVAANAGHTYPCISRSAGSFELVSDEHDMMLAIIENKRFRQHEFTLDPGDCLFVYTDGVSEAMNEKEELFGTERMLNALNEDSDAVPEELLKTVREEVDSFAGDAEQYDDITMMCLKYHGAGAD